MQPIMLNCRNRDNFVVCEEDGWTLFRRSETESIVNDDHCIYE